MSNQIYSNGHAKYYEHPGFDVYVLPADIDVAGGAVQLVTWSNTPTIKQCPQTLVEMSSPGIIAFEEPGIYSLKIVIDFQVPTFNIANFQMALVLNSTTRGISDALVDVIRETETAASGQPAHFSASLSFVGYMAAGDRFDLAFTNFDAVGSHIARLYKNTSNLFLCKLY